MKQKVPKNAKMPFTKVIKKKWRLIVMLLPAMIFVFVFSYLPMTGIILAFKKYQVTGGIFFSPWNGLRNFRTLFLTNKMWIASRNTFLYNLAFIFLGLIFEMGSAILLNEVIFSKFKKTAQSFMFLPYFISWVVAGAIMYNIFNYEKGIVNSVLKMVGMVPFDLYNTPGAWPFVLVFLKLWKQTGYGSIVYLAAITGLDQEMFEAASIDGANAWKKIRYLTIPSLTPTAVIMVLMAIGNIFRGDFGLFYQTVKTSSILQPTTDVIDTYVFRLLIDSSDYGTSSAAGLFQSVLCFITIMTCNGIVKHIQPDYALY